LSSRRFWHRLAVERWKTLCLEDLGLIEEGANHLLEALEGRVDTLLGKLREGREQLSVLQSRLPALEAERLELREENRELDEQNRELGDHNRDLHERLAAGESGGTPYSLPSRRAQGLSALMGHRPRATRTPASSARSTPPPPAASVTPPATPPASPADATPRKPPDSPSQGDLAIGEAPSPQALLEQWYQRYDAIFFKGHTRPLKVGIHEELSALEPWPEKLVRRALACYVNLPRYLKSVRDGAPRIDLGGEPAGTVDHAAAEHARKKLERLQAQRRQRPVAGHRSRPDESPQADADPGNPRETTAVTKDQAGKADAGKVRKAGKEDKEDMEVKGSKGSKGSKGDKAKAPATLEEKLSALLAKHNGQDASNKH
jgi:ProP effector